MDRKLLLLLVFWLTASPALAQVLTTDLPAVPTETYAVTVKMTWPQPAQVQIEEPPGELVLRFDRPLDYEAFAALAPRISRWAPGLFLGYDSLVLRLAPQVQPLVLVEDGVVVLKLALPRQNLADFEETQPQPDARLRLHLLKANLLWSTGETWAASQLLEQLLQQNLQNVEILTAQSVVESRQGRWRRASLAVDQARRLEGAETRGDLPVLGSEHAPRMAALWLHDTEDGGTQRDGLRLQGHVFLAAGLRVLLGYELAKLDADAGTPLGAQLGTDGTLSHLGALGLRYDGLSGSWLMARGTATVDGAGAVLEGELWDRLGGTRLVLGWAEPRWDLPTLAAIGATRDALGLVRTLRAWRALGRALHGEVSGQLGLHLERWRAGRDDAEVTDLMGQFSLLYTTWFAKPRFFVSYTAQHLEPLDRQLGSVNSPQVLTAIFQQNQVHSFQAGAQLPLWRWLSVEAFGGYALSVWSNNGALYGGSINWQPPSGLRASIRYQRALTSIGSAHFASNLLASLGWTF